MSNEREIAISIFPRKGGDGFKMSVSSLKRDGQILAAFIGSQVLPVPPKGDGRVFVRAESLDTFKTNVEANKARDRFYSLSLEEQWQRIGGKSIRYRSDEERDKVAITVQHYAIYRKGIKVDSVSSARVVNMYKAHPTVYTVVPTVKRTYVVTRKEASVLRGAVNESVKEAPGAVGICQNYLNRKRNRVLGDRHPGYRTTTSPGFFANK